MSGDTFEIAQFKGESILILCGCLGKGSHSHFYKEGCRVYGLGEHQRCVANSVSFHQCLVYCSLHSLGKLIQMDDRNLIYATNPNRDEPRCPIGRCPLFHHVSPPVIRSGSHKQLNLCRRIF